MSESSEAHKHTNRLIHSTSPYLLQHAHNPVNWYEWGPEALAQAKAENKPIFLSIGYSACHWCHVMERESFESEEIAAVMNEHFVCIKVDREERPDLDEIYMAATQALTRSGGWPMSVWLTPDQRPFFAGTYFPPTERYGRPGFKEVLLYLSGAWNDEREKVVQQAAHLTEAVRQMTRVEPGNSIVPVSVVDDTADRLAAAFDVVKGGMSGGGTNKFPPSMAMDLMLRVQHARTASGDKSTRLVELVEITLDHMARGGIYDHLGGGIARYSTDTDWLVPHFEKMLYDQALVSDIYLKAYRYTGKALYAETAADIFDYVITDLQSPEGGYYSTRDADSEGEEGKFYVWTHGEVVSVLGDEAAALFCDYYDVTEGGNWEGHNILNIQRPIETVAKLNEIAVDELKNRLAASRKKLFDIREQRIKPGLDDKVLSGWNGLMIASMAKGARILDNDRYCRSAEAAADFVLSKMRDAEGRLLRTYRKGKTHTLAYLDDYAFMIDALITLYETTFEEKRLEQAEALNAQLLEHYRDQESGGFFLTSDEAEETLVRAKSITDNAIPSGNSVQFMNLQRLSVLLGRKDLAEEAQGTLKAFSKRLTEMPFASERMLTGLDFFHRRPREIAIACRRESQVGADALVNAAWQAYVPNAIIARLIEDAPDADSVARKVPLLSGKKTLDGRPTAYVCENYACQAPTTEVKTLLEQLGKQALSEQ